MNSVLAELAYLANISYVPRVMGPWQEQFEPAVAEQGPSKPRFLGVLGLLVAAAGLFSWLGAYAVTDALVAADLLAAWPAGHDPRPGWMLRGFIGLMAAFAMVAMIATWRSRRQLRRIDAIGE